MPCHVDFDFCKLYAVFLAPEVFVVPGGTPLCAFGGASRGCNKVESEERRY